MRRCWKSSWRRDGSIRSVFTSPTSGFPWRATRSTALAAGATMPLGLEDASKLPKITDALLKKGYTEKDVTKILGVNILRVMEAVERVAVKGEKGIAR